MSTGDIDVSIDLAEAEHYARSSIAMLGAMRAKHDLTRWEFTRKIRIAPFEIPHSHPVLTLNGMHAHGEHADELKFLQMYLHEQIHWGLDLHRPVETGHAIAAFRERYPDAHRAPPETAADEHSTYLHYVVNWLELEALATLFAREQVEHRARNVHYYRSIYAAVVDAWDDVRSVLEETKVLPFPRAG
ncbi:MAG: hypothetical protein AAF441_23770 [Pseudomonadota bacterium]